MDKNSEISLSIVETKGRETFIINEDWNRDKFLLWPPNHILKKYPKGAVLSIVPTSDWTKINDFKILQKGIRNNESVH